MRQRRSPPRTDRSRKATNAKGASDQTMPKGNARNDQQPILESKDAKPVERPASKKPPTGRRRNRKGPDSRVSQNNSSLTQTECYGNRQVNGDRIDKVRSPLCFWKEIVGQWNTDDSD
jgi:hypothetical protein